VREFRNSTERWVSGREEQEATSGYRGKIKMNMSRADYKEWPSLKFGGKARG